MMSLQMKRFTVQCSKQLPGRTGIAMPGLEQHDNIHTYDCVMIERDLP